MYSQDLLNITDRLIEADPCSLVLRTALTLEDISSNVAYIRIVNTSDNKLYYVNITTKEQHDLNLSPEQLAAFDAQLKPTNQVIILSKEMLTQIKSLTKHERYSQLNTTAAPTSSPTQVNRVNPFGAIVDGLKMGYDKYADFVAFLLDDSDHYLARYKTIEAEKKSYLSQLGELKLNWAIVSAAKTITENTKRFLEQEHNNVVTCRTEFLEQITQLRPHLINNLNYHLQTVNIVDSEKMLYELRFLDTLHSCLPETSTDIPEQIILDAMQEDKTALLIDYEQKINQFSDAECSAQVQYEHILTPISEKIAQLKAQREITLETTANNLKIKGLIPTKYGSLTKKEWAKIAGTVKHNAIDVSTGSNLALLALEYHNYQIFERCFKMHGEVDLSHKNLKQLTAIHYKDAFLSTWATLTTPASVVMARQTIETNDFSGMLLRPLEAACHTYLDEWQKTHLSFSQTPWRSDDSISATILDTIFSSRTTFNNSKAFVEKCLKIIQTAMKEAEPIAFHPQMKELLNQHTSLGATPFGLNSSRLYTDILAILNHIEGKDPKYHCLKIPSMKAVARIQTAEATIVTLQEILQREKNAHERTIRSIIIDNAAKKQELKNEFQSEKQDLIQKNETEKQNLVQKNETEKQDLIQKYETEKQHLIQKNEDEKQDLIQKNETEKQHLMQKHEEEKQALISKLKGQEQSFESHKTTYQQKIEHLTTQTEFLTTELDKVRAELALKQDNHVLPIQAEAPSSPVANSSPSFFSTKGSQP